MNTKIIDNKAENTALKVVKGLIKSAKQVNIAVGYFYLNGFNLVKEDLPDNIGKDFIRMVMGNETNQITRDEIIEGFEKRDERLRNLLEDLQEPLTEEQQNNIRNLKYLIEKEQIEIRFFDKETLHAKLYVFINHPEELSVDNHNSPGLAILGSSNFTEPGLSKNKELNIKITDRDEVIHLKTWFEELFAEAKPFNKDLLDVIEISGVLAKEKKDRQYPNLGKYMDPEKLFRYLVYKWFDGRITNLSNKDILAEFQLVGVLNVAKMLDFYNGAIVADSVGLGKSFIGMGVIEDFITGKFPNWIFDSEKKPAVLMLLPPSVISQWDDIITGELTELELDQLKSSKRIITRSHFFGGKSIRLQEGFKENNKTYEIYSEAGSELGRIHLYSLGLFQYKAGKDNPTIKAFRDRYDLILVDEAHKYRNAMSNRWNALRTLQMKSSGNPNKMLLLTATPINNSIYDLYNLIRLFSDEVFKSFSLKSVKVPELFADYAKLFKEVRTSEDEKKKDLLNKKAEEIKQKVVDEIVLLRTRKYIKENFKNTEINGRELTFNDPKPQALDYSGYFNELLQKFVLSLPERLSELNFEHTKLYGAQIVGFTQPVFDTSKDKEEKHYVQLSDIFRLLLGKRLESSIFAFEVTLQKIYNKEKNFYVYFLFGLEKIQTESELEVHLTDCITKSGLKELSELETYIEDEDLEEEPIGWFENVKKTLLAYSDDLVSSIKISLEHIESDLKKMSELLRLLNTFKQVAVDNSHKTVGKLPKKDTSDLNLDIFTYFPDPKLESLKQVLGRQEEMSESINNVQNLHGRKVIIFTQYKDTAYYLFHHLEEWVNSSPIMKGILQTKTGKSKIGLVTGDTDASTRINIKKRFAPDANKGRSEATTHGELDILVATDAFSEGVNLQDAHAIINFDLPWNPMIIVQRVGRINRIGNEKEVIVVNYYPTIEIQALVGILRKLQEKIKDITLIMGKESKILEPGETIDIQTFGQKIKNMAEMDLTDLEENAFASELKSANSQKDKFHADEFKLLKEIQFTHNYTQNHFLEFNKIKSELPFYTFIEGQDRLYSIYEFLRGGEGDEKVLEKKILSMPISKEEEIKEESPLALLKLLEKKKTRTSNLFQIADGLKKFEAKSNAIQAEYQENSVTMQRGFLESLSLKLKSYYEDSWKNDPELKKLFVSVYIPLKLLNPQQFTSKLKPFLLKENLIDELSGGRIQLNHPEKALRLMAKYFLENQISAIDLSQSKNNYGWFYEK
jgi:superfamily II DNA/RNA helicase/HKD family nuclease